MYKELDQRPVLLKAEGPEPEAPCECTCSEPVPADDATEGVPAGNRTAVQVGVHYLQGGGK